MKRGTSHCHPDRRYEPSILGMKSSSPRLTMMSTSSLSNFFWNKAIKVFRVTNNLTADINHIEVQLCSISTVSLSMLIDYKL